MSKTYKAKKKKRKRKQGFLKRSQTKDGKRILSKKRKKGRKKISV